MDHSAIITSIDELSAWRDMYRLEMGCQIIHDSIHYRPGWTEEYALTVGEAQVGYGSVAVGGPWKAMPAIYEFFILPQYRGSAFRIFERAIFTGVFFLPIPG